MDVRFRTRGGALVRVIERPGLWMPPEELGALLLDLRTVVRAGLEGGTLGYGVLDDPSTLNQAVVTIVYDENDGRPVGFNALLLLDCELRGRPERVLHLGLLMVDPAYRQQGLTGALYGLTGFLVCARNQLRPLWVSNVTQVPLVFGIVGEFIADVYPSASGDTRRTFEQLQLARQIVTRHRHLFGAGPEATFDESRFVVQNGYAGVAVALKKRFDDAPKHRNAAVNAMCADQLDYERGDDFLQIGRFDIGVARRYLTRSASIISPLFLLQQGAMLLVESLVAPVVQWLSPERPMGALRAARDPSTSGATG